ncbi:MAG: SMC family ATPase [Chloroherpetonaceae bacterium]|nr:SMC family ATPase [Chloroherpetonaceae bacterium]
MTPKKLRVCNFMSYGEEGSELNFDLFHVACITGENGAGKSSLVEAIPWCLWGRSLRGRNAELIRRGATHAYVEFEFTLDGEERLYKVKRSLQQSRGNTASQTLEFFVWNDENGRFHPLSLPNQRETQARIEREIGISYDTFINASFLLQGRANEFTTRTATERKEILSDILQLQRYQEISEKADEKRKERERAIETTEILIQRLEEELKEEPEVAAKLEEAKRRQAELQAQKVSLEAKRSSLEVELKRLQEKNHQLQLWQQTLSNYEQQIRESLQKKQSLQQEIDALRARLATRQEIEQKAEHYEALQKRVAELDSRAAAWQRLSLELSNAQNELLRQTEMRQLQLENERSKLKRLCEEQQQLAARAAALRQEYDTLKQLLPERAQVEAQIADLPQLRQEENQLTQKRGTLAGAVAQLHTQMSSLSEKGRMFKELPDAVCPVCHSPLTPEHREKVLNEYRSEYVCLRDKKAALESELGDIDVALEALRQSISQKEEWSHKLRELERRLARLSSIELEQTEVESRQQRLSEEQERVKQAVQALEYELSSGDYAQDVRQRLAHLQSELSQLSYSPSEHDELRQQLSDLAGIQRELIELATAASELRNREAALEEAEATVQQLSEAKEKAVQQVHMLKGEVERLSSLEAEHAQVEETLRSLSNQLINVGGEVQALEICMNKLKDTRITLQNARETLQHEQEEHAQYEALRDIFSVSGIQSMLIENAVPFIEQEANLLLEKLTNNQMSLRIEMQRMQQNGRQVDSLEIRIIDSTGNSRDYETFSGGEKFRIDFSLRIALSKLLAVQHQVGVKMLVIDEGFGTQDVEGLEAIIEAINAVRTDFEKILLITHIDRLREAFESKIYVTRDAKKGSHFTVHSA